MKGVPAHVLFLGASTRDSPSRADGGRDFTLTIFALGMRYEFGRPYREALWHTARVHR